MGRRCHALLTQESLFIVQLKQSLHVQNRDNLDIQQESRSGNLPHQGHLMIREDSGGPDAPFDGKENVIEGIFEKLKAVNSELIASVG